MKNLAGFIPEQLALLSDLPGAGLHFPSCKPKARVNLGFGCDLIPLGQILPARQGCATLQSKLHTRQHLCGAGAGGLVGVGLLLVSALVWHHRRSSHARKGRLSCSKCRRREERSAPSAGLQHHRLDVSGAVRAEQAAVGAALQSALQPLRCRADLLLVQLHVAGNCRAPTAVNAEAW